MWQFDLVRRKAMGLVEVTTWLGQMIVLAISRIPVFPWTSKFLRGPHGERASVRPAGCKRKPDQPKRAPSTVPCDIALYENSVDASKLVVTTFAPRNRAAARRAAIATRRPTAARDWRHRVDLAAEAQIAAWVGSIGLGPADGPAAAPRTGLPSRLRAGSEE